MSVKVYIATIGDREYRIELLDEHRVKINGQEYDVDFTAIGGHPLYSLLASGRSFEVSVHPLPEAKTWHVLLRGRLYEVVVEDEEERRLRAQAGVEREDRRTVRIKSPMPGLVVDVKVEPGQDVAKGEVLLILESMKMQNEIKAPRAGRVSAVFVQAGQSVAQGEPLVQID